MAAIAAGCGGGDGDDACPGDDPTAAPTTAAVATTAPAPTGPATELTLRIADVRLLNSEESDNAMRVLLPPGVASASVTLTGLPSPNRVISVCQAQELDRRMNAPACRQPADGEAVTVTLGSAASGVEILQLGVAGPGPEGSSAFLSEVVVRYSASSRAVNARLAQIASGDTGTRPTFSLSPPGADGAFRATVNWSAIPVFGGTATGAVIEVVRDGSTLQSQSGGAGLSISGTVPPPVGNAAIRVQNDGSAALVGPRLELLLP
jgi:hypothetical protein